jgi:hypothetical protein
MEFDYNIGMPFATHKPTGAIIAVEPMGSNGEVGLSLSTGSEGKVPPNEVDGVFSRLRQDIGDQMLRSRFQRMVITDFAGDLSFVENVLARHPSRKATLRTIQSWLSRRDRVSSRRCPPWAVTTLEEYLGRHPETKGQREKSQALEQKFRTSGLASEYDESAMWRTNREAETRFLRDQRLRDRLCSAPTSALTNVIFEEFLSVSRRL